MVAADIIRSTQIAEVLRIEELSRIITLRKTHEAVSEAGRLALTDNHLTLHGLLYAIMIVCASPPVAAPTERDGPQNNPRRPRHDTHDQYHDRGYIKRTKWRDDAVADILEYIPGWEDEATAINVYEVQLIRALKTKVPNLLQEVKPFMTVMEASIEAHSKNSLCAQTLQDAGAEAHLRKLLKSLEMSTQNLFTQAIRSPREKRSQQNVTDAIREGNKCIRAVYLRTNPDALLQTEADNLLKWIVSTKFTSQMDFIYDVDNRVAFCFELWGSRDTARIISTGSSLTRVLPAFVHRLDATLQDRSLTFFNSILHAYAKLPEKRRPPPLREAMRRLKNKQMLGNLEQPDYDQWLSFESTDLEAEALELIKGVAELEPQYDVNARYLIVPDDLSIIAESGIMLTHFRPYMGRLRGTHSKLYVDGSADLFGSNQRRAPMNSSGRDSE